MKNRYSDIKGRIDEEPTWYDQNGAPRYGPFLPELCPDIYSDKLALLRIACQQCGRQFSVEMHQGVWPTRPFHPKKLHYGDPPAHGCVGDTMNCVDLEVLEAWHRPHPGDWVRQRDLEGLIDAPQWYQGHTEADGDGLVSDKCDLQ